MQYFLVICIYFLLLRYAYLQNLRQRSPIYFEQSRQLPFYTGFDRVKEHKSSIKYTLPLSNHNINNIPSDQIDHNKEFTVNSTLQKIFNLIDTSEIEQKFGLKSVKILYPDTYNDLKKITRCVLSAFSTVYNKEVILKFELNSKVRMFWDKDKKKIVTATFGSLQYIGTYVPMESYIARLVNNKPGFVKYYGNFSQNIYNRYKQLIDILYVYAYEKVPNAMNLLDFSKKVEKELSTTNSSVKDLENRLKTYFYQIIDPLNALLDERFIYTDLKPENVLIDTEKHKSYLIDLESVQNNLEALNRTEYIRTPGFFPEIAGDGHRLLTYTLSMTIYYSICRGREKTFNPVKPVFRYETFITCYPKFRGPISFNLARLFNRYLTYRPNLEHQNLREMKSEKWFTQKS